MTAIYETPLPDVDPEREAIRRAIEKAEAHGPFADRNHVFGVLAEEMAEVLDEIRGDGVGFEAELYDLVGAALKAIRQVRRGAL